MTLGGRLPCRPAFAASHGISWTGSIDWLISAYRLVLVGTFLPPVDRFARLHAIGIRKQRFVTASILIFPRARVNSRGPGAVFARGSMIAARHAASRLTADVAISLSF
jgi:hypothetical protein